MPTIPDHRIQFETLQDLCSFFRAFQREHRSRSESLILSLAVSIPPVDPLSVLQYVGQQDDFQHSNYPLNCPHFYFEKNGQASVALDVVLSKQVSGENRYQQAKQFAQRTAQRIIRMGEASSLGKPRFFCGFAFSPEVPQQDDFTAGSVVLPRWQISRWGQQGVLVANIFVDLVKDIFSPEATAYDVWHVLQMVRKLDSVSKFASSPIPKLLKHQPVATATQFEASVLAALETIAQQRCTKIVLAHALDITLSQPIAWIQAIRKLRHTHSNCYIFSSSSDNGAIFLGASPEKLASVQGNLLTTDALAGSAPRGYTELEELHLAKDLLASTKERLEHQVVVDFIQQRLRQLGMNPKLLPAQLLQLANIQHLHTPLQATLPEQLHLLDIIAALHPTPAVAGFPQQVACNYIDYHESFSRSRYAGPVGWVDVDGNGEFAVGIRSAILKGATARLFAGAGIVAGSDPAQEFAEVQLKLKALLSTFLN